MSGGYRGCGATADAHCCWVILPSGKSIVCPHFDPTPPAFAEGHCRLRYTLGNWAAVHASPQFLQIWPDGMLCGEWTPDTPNSDSCPDCGWQPYQKTELDVELVVVEAVS